MDGINVFTPSLILINFRPPDITHSKSVRVRGTINNMERLNLLNALCRKICDGVLDFEQAKQELHAIERRPLYPLWASYLAYGAAAFFFCAFLGRFGMGCYGRVGFRADCEIRPECYDEIQNESFSFPMSSRAVFWPSSRYCAIRYIRIIFIWI